MDLILNFAFPALQWTCLNGPWDPFGKNDFMNLLSKSIGLLERQGLAWSPFLKLGFLKKSGCKDPKKKSTP